MATINIPITDGEIEVVFNSSYGGFSISEAAIIRMIELGSEEAKRYYEEIKSYNNYGAYYPRVARFDPILVQVVKELKNKASGTSASLAIGKVRLDDLVDIEEYDGKETVRRCYDYKIFGRHNEEYDTDD